MPVTPEQAQMLATLARAIRPHGARRWDESGIVVAIGRVKHLSLADVCQAVIRAADDRSLETPGAIGNPAAPCWSERKPDRPQPLEPWDSNEFCEHTQKPLDRCDCGSCVSSAQWVARVTADGPKPRLPRAKDVAS